MIGVTSAGPKPDLGHGRGSAVELVVHVPWSLAIVFVHLLVVPVRGVAPPSVQQHTEEEGEDDSCVEVGRVDIEDAVALQRGGGVPPQAPVAGQWAGPGDESGEVLGHLFFWDLHSAGIEADVLLPLVIDF